MESYRNEISDAISLNPTFKSICNYNIKIFPKDGFSTYYHQLNHGALIPRTVAQLNAYLACYSDMHREKLNLAFETLFKKVNLDRRSIDLVDWGCGQAFASCTFFDFIKSHRIKAEISAISLIEPSEIALERGIDHLSAIYQKYPLPKITRLNQNADKFFLLKENQKGKIKLHLFSNILDLYNININHVYQNIINNFDGINYMICVSPINPDKLKKFYRLFKNSKLLSWETSCFSTEVFRPSLMKRINKNISRVECIFKVYM